MLPPKKCEATLKLIHKGHLGPGKCTLRAKYTEYWPDFNNQLEKSILNCELCFKYSQAKFKSKPTKALKQEVTLLLWSKFATDIFHFEGTSYLLIVDYTSRFLIVHKLTSMTGKQVPNQCRPVFSEYGWPDTLICDNGQCYTLQEFTSLMQALSVNHIISSPHYPQYNKLAEKYVQLVKCLFNKVKEEGKDFHKCLMIYCYFPYQVACKYQCRSQKERVLGLTWHCPMQLEISIDSSQKC